jgi:maltose phosphorylase
MRTVDGLRFSPFLPTKWEGYAFQLLYRNKRLRVEVDPGGVKVVLLGGEPLNLKLYQETYKLKDTVTAALQ